MEKPVQKGDWVKTFVEAYEEYTHGLVQQYFSSAVLGWRYTSLLESEFINPSLEPIPCATSKPKYKERYVSLPHSHLEPNTYIERISSIDDLEESWACAQALIDTHDDVVLGDSFLGLDEKDLEPRLRQAVSGDGLNIVILGAGCVGLCLASTFKTTMGNDVNILVIENRTYKKHVKRPYARNWLTQLDANHLSFLPENIRAIFKKFGTSKIGLPINLFETLALLSCKSMGVSFYFDDQYDLSFIKNSSVDLIFDCTGGRLGSTCGIESSKPDTSAFSFDGFEVKSAAAAGAGNFYEPFAITRHTRGETLTFELFQEEGAYYPCAQGHQIKTAIVKILNIPSSFHQDLVETVIQDNDDGKFFLWPGNLPEQINHFITHINLEKPVFETLSALIQTKMTLAEFLDLPLDGFEKDDPRFFAYLQAIKAQGVDLNQAMIDRPFLYVPYAVHIKGRFQQYHSRSVIPMGDSVYNGSPKAGNGLGHHVAHMHKMHCWLEQFYNSINR